MTRWVAGLVLVLAAAACGPRPQEAVEVPEASFDTLAVAAQATAAEQTAEFTMTMTFGGVEGPLAQVLPSISMRGAMDFANQSMRGTMETVGGTFPTGLLGGQIIRVDGSAYTQLGIFDAIGLQGRWLAAPASPTMPGLDAFSNMTGGLGGQSGGDPLAIMDQLAGLGVEVTQLGVEEVLGEPMQHLSADVSVADFTGESASTPDLWDALADVTVAVDSWVDAQGRARRVQMAFDFGESLAGIAAGAETATAQAADISGLTMTMLLEFPRFGVPVDVVAPDPSTVIDQAQFQAALTSNPAALQELFGDMYTDAAGASGSFGN